MVAHHGRAAGALAGVATTVRPFAPTTVSSYRAAMDRYILPALGKLPVRQVDAATLDAFYAHLRTRGGKDGRPLKASTVHEVHAVLSGALKQAVVWGWVGHNPAKLAATSAHSAMSALLVWSPTTRRLGGRPRPSA
jgi:integrase